MLATEARSRPRSRFFRTRTRKARDTYAEPEIETTTAVWSVANTLLVLLAIIIAFFVIAGILLANAFPISGITGALVLSAEVHSDYRSAITSPDVNSKEWDNWIELANFYENVWNFLYTALDLSIQFWDLVQGILIFVVQIIFDVVVVIFKYILGQPFIRDTAIEVGLWCAEVLRLIVGAAAEIEEDQALFEPQPQDVPGEDFGVVFGAADDPGASGNKFWVNLAQFCIDAIVAFFKAIGNKIEALAEFIFNVLLKNITKIYKAIVNIVSWFDDTLGGKWMKDAVNVLFGLGNYLNGDCIQAALQNGADCAFRSTVGAGWNAMRSALKSINIGGIPKIDGCDSNKIDKNCGGGTGKGLETDYKELARSIEANNTQPVFGAGICNDAECTRDILGVLDDMMAVSQTCDFWVGTGNNSTLTCLAVMRDYSFMNSTTTADAPIETISAEFCIVLHEHILRRCEIAQPPFSFDFNVVANAVCVDDKSGDPTSFNTACSCEFEEPMCDAGCCDQYSRHVHYQTLDLIGERTCGEVLTFFPESTLWCPLMGESAASVLFLSDYTFTHMWCAWYQQVLLPRCANPLIKVKDVGADLGLPAYSASSCGAVVPVVGVCVSINPGISDISMDFLSTNYLIDSDAFFEQNRAQTFTPQPIVTIHGNAATAEDIIFLTVDKYYCQQFSLMHNNTNGIFRSRPWSVQSVVGAFCDTQIATALFSIDISNDVRHKFRDVDNNLRGGTLAGLDPEIPAFGTAVGTVDCDTLTGLDPTEISDHHTCVVGLQEETNLMIGEVGSTSDQSLLFLAQTSLIGDTFDHTGDLDDIDPNDPQAARKMQEVEETDAVQDITQDWSVVPIDEQVSKTDPFRRNKVTVPPDGDPQDQNPWNGITHQGGGGGRTLLSIKRDPAPKATLDVPGLWGRIQDADNPGRVLREALSEFFWKPVPVENTYSYWRKQRLQRRNRRILDRAYDEVIVPLEARLNARAVFEKNITYHARKVAFETHTAGRHLLSTNDPEFDVRAAAVLETLRRRPNIPPRITAEQYATFRTTQAEALLDDLARVSETTVIPRIWEMFYSLAMNGTLPDFGGDPGAGDKLCRATMDKPYQCCNAESTAFQCCRGFITCIPMLPRELYVNLTTVETASKWECPEFDNYFEYWITLLRIIFSAIINTVANNLGTLGDDIKDFFGSILYTNDTLPDNTGPCLLANQVYLWLGLLVVYAVTALFALQMFTEIGVYYTDTSQEVAMQRRFDMYEADLREIRAYIEMDEETDQPDDWDDDDEQALPKDARRFPPPDGDDV